LTKRPERLAELAPKLDFSDNIWVGVSVEHADYLDRVDLLRGVTASVRFISCEPLLGSLDGLNLEGIGWVIAGGESGPGARPMAEQWVTELRDACITEEVPFFYKQSGAVRGKGGCMLEDQEWKQYPNRVA
jgi:protein gp37